MEAGPRGGCGDGREKQADLSFGEGHDRTWAGVDGTRGRGSKKGQADLTAQRWPCSMFLMG